MIGSLLVPAVTKQWSDRPKELEIKTSLIREISELTTDTVTAPVSDLYGSTPASRLLLLRKEALDKAKKARKASKADIAEAQKKYDDAYEAKTLESAKSRAERMWCGGTREPPSKHNSQHTSRALICPMSGTLSS